MWVGGDRRNSVEHKAQFCGTSKPPLYLSLFKPLGMTHLWQCYITHNALKAPAAPPGKTDSSFMVNFTISVTMEAHQRDVSMVRSPSQNSWRSSCGVERAPLVSGVCRSFLEHKDHVFTCCCFTTNNLSCVLLWSSCDAALISINPKQSNWGLEKNSNDSNDCAYCLMTVMQQLYMIWNQSVIV